MSDQLPQKVLLLAFNHQNISFWENQFISESGYAFVQHSPLELQALPTEEEPGMIIIDSYFAGYEVLAKDLDQKVYHQIRERFPKTRTYLISPTLSIGTGSEKLPETSNLCKKVLRNIRNDLRSLSELKAA